MAIHIVIQYCLNSIIEYVGSENLVKGVVLLMNMFLYCFLIWLWTQSTLKTILFFCILIIVLGLSFVGYYFESIGKTEGYVLSVLRARLIDVPLLLGIYLIGDYAFNKGKVF